MVRDIGRIAMSREIIDTSPQKSNIIAAQTRRERCRAQPLFVAPVCAEMHGTRGQRKRQPSGCTASRITDFKSGGNTHVRPLRRSKIALRQGKSYSLMGYENSTKRNAISNVGLGPRHYYELRGLDVDIEFLKIGTFK
ncbi:hypothetical protein L228DRAFT_98327 [Xylona heveae TC161]|uniref:Uncharacterized protein n=1 Tax=Xylona heveae (strain CBS 132557 / TC161) TaxID=1328760 RepID=A0A165I7W1_XYLHT|nr:hypothetical protein L228DRAFT_98327 [Xylona heveae TC161]KZF24512.1 hypothetical protein L228DRAFT_98327 [Xylona heveae TC161]